jgi:hypothetical protein
LRNGKLCKSYANLPVPASHGIETVSRRISYFRSGGQAISPMGTVSRTQQPIDDDLSDHGDVSPGRLPEPESPPEPRGMRVLVCGDPEWTDVDAIQRQLQRLPAGSVIIHGDQGYDSQGNALWGKPDELAVCGADKLAGQVARALGFDVLVYTPPEWASGRRDASAGPRRNARMIREGRPDLVLAFMSNPLHCPDAVDCLRQAAAAGIEYRTIRG